MITDNQLNVLRLRQEAVMDSLNEGVIILDSNFEVVDVNKAFINLFAIKEKNLRGLKDSKLYEILSGYFDEEFKDKFEEVIKTVVGSTKLIGENYDSKIIKPREVFVNVFTAPIYDDDRGFVGRIWKFENINEMKLMDNMKTEFISIASHQLRSPLTAINGNIDMMISGDFGSIPPGIKESMNDVRKATQNLQELVNGLLDVSRLEMGKIEADYETTDIGNTIRDLIRGFETLIKSKNLSVNVDAPKGLNYKIDKRLFTESLKNLVSNAIKYSQKDGVVLITADIRKNKLYVEVSDNGVGVPRNQYEGLFKKFFRADNVQTLNIEGTGLGLYYVKKSIEAMGGTVGFKPGQMNGSIFYFEIPQN